MHPDAAPPPAKRQRHDCAIENSRSSKDMGAKSTKIAPVRSTTSTDPTTNHSSGGCGILKRPSTSPTCHEFFHKGGCSDIRPCGSTLHEVHNVCTDCHDQARTFLTLREQDVEDNGAAALLCMVCAADVVKTHGVGYDSCTCPFLTYTEGEEVRYAEWFCFQCRQTALWRAGMVKCEWGAYQHGDRKSLLESQDRWNGVVEGRRSVCPKCQVHFSPERGLESKKAVVDACLVCEGAIVKVRVGDGAEAGNSMGKGKAKGKERVDSKEDVPMLQACQNPFETAPAFSLPQWTGQITGRRRPALVQEDIAPDELPEVSAQDNIASLARHHIKVNVVTTQLASIGSRIQNPPTQQPQQTSYATPSSQTQRHPTFDPSSPLQQDSTEWKFPRNPKRTPYNSTHYQPHPQPRRYTLDELIEVRHAAWEMRSYYREFAACWNCGGAGHAWESCERPDGMRGLEREIERVGLREWRKR